MATLYYDPVGGSDAADGLSVNTPKKNLPTSLVAGNTYLLKDGTVCAPSATVQANDNNIISTWYGGKAYFQPAAAAYFSIVNHTNVSVSNITFWPGPGADRLVNISGSSALKFTDCTLDSQNATTWGMRVINCTGTVSFVGCTFTNALQDLIYGENLGTISFDQCDFSNPNGANDFTGDCIQLSGTNVSIGALIVTRSRFTNLLDGKQCIICNPSGTGVATLVSISNSVLTGGYYPLHIANATTILLHRNRLEAVKSNVGIHDTLECALIETSGAISASSNVFVAGAIATRGLHFVGCSGPHDIYNNVFDGGTTGSLLLQNGGSGAANVKNNVFLNSITPSEATLWIGGAGYTISTANNSWLRNATSMGFFNATRYDTVGAMQGAGYETNSIVGDQRLSDSYRPLAGSPLIAAGTHLGYGEDFNGAQRWNPPTIGAYEYIRPRTAGSARPARV